MCTLSSESPPTAMKDLAADPDLHYPPFFFSPRSAWALCKLSLHAPRAGHRFPTSLDCFLVVSLCFCLSQPTIPNPHHEGRLLHPPASLGNPSSWRVPPALGSLGIDPDTNLVLQIPGHFARIFMRINSLNTTELGPVSTYSLYYLQMRKPRHRDTSNLYHMAWPQAVVTIRVSQCLRASHPSGHLAWICLSFLSDSALMGNQLAADQPIRGKGENHTALPQNYAE